ncbi:hypothetical protein LCGC14_1435220 [marine sediment metagenome]|uniref:Uncharacterized protein n=1 Tax=marine sediment metagenome TaxID=412755 RepID=A0A0F9JMC4_9ZZZZ
MAELDINGIIVLTTLFVIFGIFLIFDLFKRNEKYGYLAYIVAIIPVNSYWALGYDPLVAFLILVILWDITLLRDTIGVYLKKDKEINEILLFLTLAVLIQIIVSAILPEVMDELQVEGTERYLYFWFPDVHAENIFANSVVIGFKVAATLLVFLVIIPLLLDIKDEKVPLPIFILIIGIFIVPFIYIAYLWLPEYMGVLTFLFSVILFVVLLLITKSGLEKK